MTADGPSVLVLGAGSIGSRHARNLLAAGARVRITDPDPARAEAVEGATAVPFDDLGSIGGLDGVVVASPTIRHAEHLRWALGASPRVLVEKPLAMAPDEVADLVATDGHRVMVGYNLRFHEPLQRVAALVHGGQLGRIIGLAAWFGSWLPDWRPAVDYRTTYSAQRALGGGVLLDAIHELDLLVWLAGDGDFEVAGAVLGTSGALELDVEDIAHALLRHRNGWVAHVGLDYLSRRYRRGVEVVGTEGTARYDWARGVLEVDHAAGSAVEPIDPPLDTAYEQEAEAFLAFVGGTDVPPVDGAGGLASLDLARRIIEAAR